MMFAYARGNASASELTLVRSVPSSHLFKRDDVLISRTPLLTACVYAELLMAHSCGAIHVPSLSICQADIRKNVSNFQQKNKFELTKGVI